MAALGDATGQQRLHVARLAPLELDEAQLDTALPLGPEDLLYSQLDNGLTYYVRRNAKPQRRAALALVVRVGSLSETEDARGVAHFVEHLAFNATEAFTKHSLVEFLESAGLPFGAYVCHRRSERARRWAHPRPEPPHQPATSC